MTIDTLVGGDDGGMEVEDVRMTVVVPKRPIDLTQNARRKLTLRKPKNKGAKSKARGGSRMMDQPVSSQRGKISFFFTKTRPGAILSPMGVSQELQIPVE